jgi:hypothetical protein
MSNPIKGNVIIDKSSRWIELFKIKIYVIMPLNGWRWPLMFK